MLLTAIVPIGNISNCSRNLVQRLQQAISLDIQVKLVFDRITVRDSEEFLRSLNSEKHLEVIQGVFGQPGLARNAALEEVRSTWLTFWDSDDDIYPNKVKEMVMKADKEGSNLAIGNFELYFHSPTQSPLLGIYSPSTSHSPDFKSTLGLWRMAFRTKTIFLEGIKFPPIRVGEDVLFVNQVLKTNPPIFTFKDFVYQYSVGGHQQTTNVRSTLEETSRVLASLLQHKNVNLSSKSHELIRQLIVLQLLTLLRTIHKSRLFPSSSRIQVSSHNGCLSCRIFVIPQVFLKTLKVLMRKINTQ